MSESNLGRVFAVIFAGGVGSRMKGARIPKQFLKLGGKPIIAHTLDVFQCCAEVNAVVVACYEPAIHECECIVEDFAIDKVKAIVAGGKTGQDSIFNGLSALQKLNVPPQDDDVVLIHDGVRPLVDVETLRACIDSVRNRGCTAVCAPVTETIAVVQDGKVIDLVDRASCRLARAPQGFRFGELMRAHLSARTDGFHEAIDSISLMSRYGHEVHVVMGPEENIKITTPRDFFAYKGFMDFRELGQLWDS